MKKRKRKQLRLKNKKLLRRYPWLWPTGWDGNPLPKERFKYDFTLLDEIPLGWKKSFGMMLIQEMDEARCGGVIYTHQIKEKWGRLEWYCSAPNGVSNVIDKYSAVSENICVHCGKPDVGYTTQGWIIPICKHCYEKTKHAIAYEDAVNQEDTQMATEIHFRRFSPEGAKDITVDISETTEKIRMKWKSRANHG